MRLSCLEEDASSRDIRIENLLSRVDEVENKGGDIKRRLKNLESTAAPCQNWQPVGLPQTNIFLLGDSNSVVRSGSGRTGGHWVEPSRAPVNTARSLKIFHLLTVSSNLVCGLVPLNHIKNMINDKVNSLTHKRWNSNRHAHTDLILGNHHTKTLKILTNNLNNRTRYRTGICIITGHRPQQTPSHN